MDIDSKEKLEQYFEERMNKSYVEYKKSKNRNTYDSNLLKSYVIENHVEDGNCYHDTVVNKLMEMFKSSNNEYRVTETKLETLLKIKSSELEVFLDITDMRYWVIHTMSKSSVTDEFRRKILKNTYFDNMWIPTNMFNKINERKYIYGVSVNFYDDFSKDIYFENENQELNFTAQKGDAQELINLFKSSEKFNYKVAITKMSVLNNAENINIQNDKFIIDDIKYDGKVTAKGNSFMQHQYNLTELIFQYKNIINYLENKMSLSFDEHGICGSPIEIVIKRKGLNLSKLVELMFSSNLPFRLWGIPEWKSENYVRVQGVDLHTGNKGNKLNFEIAPNLIRVYLPNGSCGNSIMRLITNLNHHVDAMIEVRGLGEDDLFSITD